MSARVMRRYGRRWVEDSAACDKRKLVVCECGLERADDQDGPCDANCDRGHDDPPSGRLEDAYDSPDGSE